MAPPPVARSRKRSPTGGRRPDAPWPPLPTTLSTWCAARRAARRPCTSRRPCVRTRVRTRRPRDNVALFADERGPRSSQVIVASPHQHCVRGDLRARAPHIAQPDVDELGKDTHHQWPLGESSVQQRRSAIWAAVGAGDAGGDGAAVAAWAVGPVTLPVGLRSGRLEHWRTRQEGAY
jgi:hypothetical protein